MRQAGSHRSYGSKVLSSVKARQAAWLMLVGCKPERLAEMTAEGLCASFNIKPGEAADMLARAKGARRV